MSTLSEQLQRRTALRTERTGVCNKLLSEAMPEEERQAWQRRLIELDGELQATEAASAPPPPAEDPEATRRAARAAEIRAIPGFLNGGVDPATGAPLLGYIDREKLRQELLTLEVPVIDTRAGA